MLSLRRLSYYSNPLTFLYNTNKYVGAYYGRNIMLALVRLNFVSGKKGSTAYLGI